ncbi:hypothetical protein BHM03_00060380 [Ensete ventricosum]|nr:hypothetical protein BHM03_00060380 [Ensete ventricosum]
MVKSNMASNVASASRSRHDSATLTQHLPPDLTSGYPLTALWPTNYPPCQQATEQSRRARPAPSTSSKRRVKDFATFDQEVARRKERSCHVTKSTEAI